MLKKILAGVVGSCFLFGNASASYIDFSDIAFSSISGQSYTEFTDVQGSSVDLAISASPAFASAVLSYSADGIGITSNDNLSNSEINGVEFLTLYFENDPVTLTRLDVSNLFSNDFTDYGLPEVGIFTSMGETWYDFDAGVFIGNSTTGDYTLNLNLNNVTQISFAASPIFFYSDFTVKGIGVESVPEPTTISLIGIGLLSLAGINFIRRKK